MFEDSLAALAKSTFVRGEYLEAEGSVRLHFSDGTVLVCAFWRLIENGKARLSAQDHEQQYGLSAPIDAPKELFKCLNEAIVENARLDRETGDLNFVFSGNRKLQVFRFTGYEAWHIQFPSGEGEFSNYVLQ
jgi:hypothetical protein